MPPSDRSFKIAIIGKQEIKPAESKGVYDKIKLRIDSILKKKDIHSFEAYSAMARGADTIFAEVVTNEFHQPVKIILPFAREEYSKNFTDDEDIKVLNNWIEKNGVAKTIVDGNSLDDNQKDEAYFQTGKYFIDHCDEVIIVWDNLKPTGKGGTADMLGLLATGKNATHEIHIIKTEPARPDYFQKEVGDKKKHADKEAILLKKQYTRAWKSSILLAWLASVCFAIEASSIFATKASLKSETIGNVMTTFEFLCVFIIVIIVRTYSKNQHQSLIRQRIMAERLRLIEFFYAANLSIDHAELKGGSDGDIAELVQRANDKIKDNAYFSPHYSSYCVKKLIEEQIKYYESLLKGKSVYRLSLFKKAREVIIDAFLINLLISFISTVVDWSGYKAFYPHEISVFFGILLSATFATIETILFFTEWRDEQIHSGNMLSFFKSKQIESKNGHWKIPPGDLLKEISIKMLTENKDWEAVIRERQVELTVP